MHQKISVLPQQESYVFVGRITLRWVDFGQNLVGKWEWSHETMQ